MSAGEARDIHEKKFSVARESSARRHRVLAKLSDEQMAAAEGWRLAHGITEQSDALGELIRLGLLSEITKIYKLVSDNRPNPVGSVRNGARKFKDAEHIAE